MPVDVTREVWERDGGQCTFVDAQGRRCSARRFVTIEHREPYALGGPATVDNLCLLCAQHNAHAARKVFGADYIEAKQNQRKSQPVKGTINDPYAKVHGALRKMGFTETEVRRAISELRQMPGPADLQSLLRAALQLLAPPDAPKIADSGPNTVSTSL